MKKIFAVLSMAFVVALMPVKAQPGEDFFNLGVRGGLNFSNMSGIKDMGQDGFLKTYTGFNAGLVFNFNLPLGFELNPELLYVQSGVKKDGVPASLKTGSLRLPVNIQWGIRLLGVVKPYVVFSPYIGGVLFSEGTGMLDIEEKFINRLQYGVGIGAGVYIWRFQVSFKWNWDLNTVIKENSEMDLPHFGELKDKKFNGGELSLAFFF